MNHTAIPTITVNLDTEVFPDSDGMHIGSNTYVLNCTGVAAGFNPDPEVEEPHVDYGQLIPRVKGKDNRQYAAALASNILLANNEVDGKGSDLQAFFGTDGRFNNLICWGNRISAKNHSLTFGGVIWGSFFHNTDLNGIAIPAVLWPLKIAGDINIISFKDLEDCYLECDGLVEDYRQVPFKKPWQFYLEDFDLKSFLLETEETLPAKGSAEELVPIIRQIALKHGSLMIKEEVIITNSQGVTIMNEVYNYTLSDEGVDLLIESEGKEYHVYKDVNKLPTTGIGHYITRAEHRLGYILIGKHKHFFNHTLLTEELTVELFQQDMDKRLLQLNKFLEAVPKKLTQYEFDALFCFYYNIGYGNFRDSTCYRKLKALKWKQIPDAIAMWNLIDGDVHKGIVNRRNKTIAHWKGHSKLAQASAKVSSQSLPDDSILGIEVPEIKEVKEVKEVREYHDHEFQSTTIQGICIAFVSSILAWSVAAGHVPEGMANHIQPYIVEYVGLAGVAIGSWWARRGRHRATKAIR